VGYALRNVPQNISFFDNRGRLRNNRGARERIEALLDIAKHGPTSPDEAAKAASSGERWAAAIYGKPASAGLTVTSNASVV